MSRTTTSAKIDLLYLDQVRLIAENLRQIAFEVESMGSVVDLDPENDVLNPYGVSARKVKALVTNAMVGVQINDIGELLGLAYDADQKIAKDA